MAEMTTDSQAESGQEPGPQRLTLEGQRRRVQALRMAVYTQDDPSADEGLLRELAKAEGDLQAMEKDQAERSKVPAESHPGTPRGQFLGANSTGLVVKSTLNMQPIPIGIYPSLDPDEFPFLTVTIKNVSRDSSIKRVCVRAYLEGLSAQAAQTVE